MSKQSIIPTFEIKTYKKKDKNHFSSTSIIDFVSEEKALQIVLRKNENSLKSQNFVVSMRTPGNDEAFVFGFLFTEGIIKDKNEVLEIKNKDNRIEVLLSQENDYTLNSVTRNFFTSSSCGVCSKKNLTDLESETNYLPYSSTLKIEAKKIFGIQEIIFQEKGIFEKTGGMHSAVLLNDSLEFIERMEDVGRHNALDKLIGSAFMKDHFPLTNSIALLSGRISFELVQKSAKAGIPIIIAKGAPTSLAIEEAYAQSICLIGFCKDKSYNVYCGSNRIKE